MLLLHLRRSWALAAVVSVAVISMLWVADRASAGNNLYCNPVTIATYNTCQGPQHSLRQNWAIDYYGANNWVGAWAAQGGSVYASPVIAQNYACHPYGGSNVLVPLLYNPYLDGFGNPTYITMYGHEFWGSEPAC